LNFDTKIKFELVKDKKNIINIENYEFEIKYKNILIEKKIEDKSISLLNFSSRFLYLYIIKKRGKSLHIKPSGNLTTGTKLVRLDNN